MGFIPDFWFSESGIEELTLPINIEMEENAIRDCNKIRKLNFLDSQGKIIAIKENLLRGIECGPDLIDIIKTIKK